MTIWITRILFLLLCGLGGYGLTVLQPTIFSSPYTGVAVGLLFALFLILIDQLLRGFSLRAFSAITFGLLLGFVVSQLIDRSGLFETFEEGSTTRWLIRVGLFLAFGYIGMILAMRSNKEDFALIIPYVRFTPLNKPENYIILDTSAIMDGRILDLTEAKLIEGIVIVPKFVLRELQHLADSSDQIQRNRARRGLEILNQLKQCASIEVKFHEADFPEEREVDMKLIRLSRNLGAKLFTIDYNLAKIAEFHSVKCVNLNEIINKLRPPIVPGDILTVKLVKEGKEHHQGVGHLLDGNLVVVNNARHMIGKEVEVEVINVVKTAAGYVVFGELKKSIPE